MTRAVVNVSSDSWVRGQKRLGEALVALGEKPYFYTDVLPRRCPPHRSQGFLAGHPANCIPYAFKAYAIQEAANHGAELLLWADASIVPVRPLDELWQKIEDNGVWLCRNGWKNSEWTADSAYPDLFHDVGVDDAMAINQTIPHVVAAAFGLNLRHPKGGEFLAEYFRLASTTKAFCGPWQNSNAPTAPRRNVGRTRGPCGPPTTLGHRHDQTAAAVIAWRLGVELDDPPARLAYEGGQVESTILVVREIPRDE